MYENKDAASKIISDHLFFRTNFRFESRLTRKTHFDNDTLICLSQSLAEIGNIHIFIQYSGRSEPVIDHPDFG